MVFKSMSYVKLSKLTDVTKISSEITIILIQTFDYNTMTCKLRLLRLVKKVKYFLKKKMETLFSSPETTGPTLEH